MTEQRTTTTILEDVQVLLTQIEALELKTAPRVVFTLVGYKPNPPRQELEKALVHMLLLQTEQVIRCLRIAEEWKGDGL